MKKKSAFGTFSRSPRSRRQKIRCKHQKKFEHNALDALDAFNTLPILARRVNPAVSAGWVWNYYCGYKADIDPLDCLLGWLVDLVILLTMPIVVYHTSGAVNKVRHSLELFAFE